MTNTGYWKYKCVEMTTTSKERRQTRYDWIGCTMEDVRSNGLQTLHMPERYRGIERSVQKNDMNKNLPGSVGSDEHRFIDGKTHEQKACCKRRGVKI